MLRTLIAVYPEGDTIEVDRELSVNQLVDLNARPIALPLPSPRMIVYRVWKITTRSERFEEEVLYHLELVTRPELEGVSR